MTRRPTSGARPRWPAVAAVLALVAAALAGVATPDPAAAETTPTVSGLTPRSGPGAGGTSVTITGTGLGGASAVSFGDVASPLFRVEGSAGGESIVAFSPRQPEGTVAPVRVRVGAAVSADGPRFTYLPGAWARTADRLDPLYLREHNAVLLDRPDCGDPSPPGAYPCGKVLVAGARYSTGPGTAEIYDPAGRGGAGTWAPTEPPLPWNTGQLATLLADGRVLVSGGQGAALAEAGAAVFDPTVQGSLNDVDVAGHWVATPNMSRPRFRHTATLLDRPDCHGSTPPPAYPCGKVLVVGGLDGSGDPQASVELFDPAADAAASPWTLLPDLLPTGPRDGHSATLLGDGTVLVAGGAAGEAGLAKGSLRYDPAANAGAGAWLPAPAMGVARFLHSATLLDRPDCHGTTPPGDFPCGKVLVAAGYPAPAPGEMAELYDPAANSGTGGWAFTGGSAVLGGFNPTMARLADGKVLAIAQPEPGAPPGSPLPAARYDPGVGAWSAVAGLPGGRNGAGLPSITALGDGRVLATNVVTDGVVANYVSDPSSTPKPLVQAIEPATGPPGGGTRVTVRGRNLFGAPDAGQVGTATSVLFGDTPAAAVDFVSDTELVATSPGHPRGRVALSVRTPAGTSPPVGAALFTYVDEGAWAPTGALDACHQPSEDPARSCAPRADHRTVLLDRADCHGASPPSDGYPCGTVLAMGRTRATFTDGDTTVGSPILTSATAAFTEADVGLAVSTSPSAPAFLPEGTMVDAVLSAATVELSASVRGNGTPTGTATGLDFVLSGYSAERYDPATGVWQPTGPMKTRGTALPAAEIDITSGTTLLPDGTVLVTGGCCDGPATAALVTAELYDPVENIWRNAPAPMPAARLHHSATLLDRADCHGARPPTDYPCGQVLVAGGRGQGIGSTSVRRSTHLYDPANRTWTDAGELATGRYAHTATLLANGDVLVVGGLGVGGGLLASAEVYDPVQGRWTAVAAPPEPKVSHGATLLDRPDCHGATPRPTAYPCGQVLVTGGGSGFSSGRTSVELYDPAANAWTSSSRPDQAGPQPMTTGRAAHSATLLPDGDVLVVGGYLDQNHLAPTVEVYEPAGRRWRPVRSMAGPRFDHSATVLEGRGCAPRCGQVLVAGGWGDFPAGDFRLPRLATAELYTPAPAVSSLAPASGPSQGGTRVVIGGTSLTGATEVRFGGVPAPITSSSLTALTVTTPEHQAGPVEVEVVTAAGSTAVRAEVERRTYTFAASRVPGPVDPLEAEAVSSSAVRLRFSAASSDGSLPPPARRYEVKVATGPIVDEAGFTAAAALCGGVCGFSPPAVGAALSLNVGGLAPGTTYHFAARALGEAGPGPLSNPASATTGGDPEPPEIAGPPPTVAPPSPSCPALGPPAPGQVAYPAGYSMVGLPQGSVVGMGSSLYSWFDQGAGGRYSTHSPTQALAGGRGYWAWFACPRLVAMGPGGAAVTSLPLGAYRASMVGNPTTRAVSVSGYDWAARWDPRLDNGAGGYRLSGYRQAQTLAPGEGIWVFSYKATTVTLR